MAMGLLSVESNTGCRETLGSLASLASSNGPMLLVCGERDRVEAERAAGLVGRLLAEAWPHRGGPRVERVAWDEAVDAAERLGGGVCWAWTGCDGLQSGEGSGEAGEAAVLRRLQERQVAVLLTGDIDELSADGITRCPRGTDPAMVCGMWHAVRAQSAWVQSARAEAALVREHHGGLRREMARIDEELRLAARLQRSFLPDATALPEVGDIRFHTLWRPAGYVGGDIYDVFRLDERRVGFFLADAVGHGVPAALMTMYIKRSLQTKMIDPGADRGYRILQPAEALEQLNADMLAPSSARDRFATALYGVIDTQTRELTLARGGHPPPLLLRVGGGVERLSPEGGLLGIFPDEPFEEMTVTLGAGDRVVLYSDGFELALRDPPDRIRGTGNDRRHMERLIALRDGDAAAGMAELEAELDREAGSLSPDDDVTLILLDVGGPTPL